MIALHLFLRQAVSATWQPTKQSKITVTYHQLVRQLVIQTVTPVTILVIYSLRAAVSKLEPILTTTAIVLAICHTLQFNWITSVSYPICSFFISFHVFPPCAPVRCVDSFLSMLRQKKKKNLFIFYIIVSTPISALKSILLRLPAFVYILHFRNHETKNTNTSILYNRKQICSFLFPASLIFLRKMFIYFLRLANSLGQLMHIWIDKAISVQKYKYNYNS